MKELVDRFLSWPLPPTVCSDLCASLQNYPNRSGTTLLNADEAEQMLKHVVGSVLEERDQLRQQVCDVADELINQSQVLLKVSDERDQLRQKLERSWYEDAVKSLESRLSRERDILRTRLEDAENLIDRIGQVSQLWLDDPLIRLPETLCGAIREFKGTKHSPDSAGNRCKHGVHGTDCFECHPKGDL